MVIINGPHVWPNSDTMIPLGSRISMFLKCISGYATQQVLELDKNKQPCQYDETGMYNQETYRFANVTGVSSSAVAIRLFYFPQVWDLSFSGMMYDDFVNVSFMFQPFIFATAPLRTSSVWSIIMVSKFLSEILLISIHFEYFKNN